MGIKMNPLILASTSPYRRELLERLQIPFECMDSKVDEDPFKDDITDPLILTKTLAYEKAKAISKDHPNAYVIGGDQISLFQGEILGKPGSVESAIIQLRKVSGHSHELITSTCILGPKGYVYEWTNRTELFMRELSLEEIKRYVEKDDPIHCAGSYKIESLGISLFDAIHTQDSTAIVGLPLLHLSAKLRGIGYITP